jgi:hypothetical protein
MANLNHLNNNTMDRVKPLLTDRDTIPKSGGPSIRNGLRSNFNQSGVSANSSIHSIINVNQSKAINSGSGGGAGPIPQLKTYRSSDTYDYNEYGQ